ncbi:MAG: type II toxin-antitoxin system VapC family toxin [Thermoanaerobaculia bacterium]
MKPLLLDTHTFLWFVFDDPRLSVPAAAAISDAEVEPILSIASLWEITIKRQLGKLDLGMDLTTFFRRYIEERSVTVLSIESSHLIAYDELPLHHRDPFDRLLVAQARALDAPIVTADPNFEGYELEIVW